ncbi:MAG TPA: site-specific integrase, partial [Gemmatales bacterium]|nr:site-specific integrase [Gemmatales bacterium]
AMGTASKSFRIGKVRGYRRGSVWYLCYHEQGKRHRPRVGQELGSARQMAAQINAQLETNIPAALSFQPLSILELRQRWLENHESVLRSSIQTIHRYRTATEHLVNFLNLRPVRNSSLFHVTHAEEFVAYLRTLKVSSNGHKNTALRPLMDKGIKFILECCRALFSYGAKRRHLSPYATNPFTELELSKIPVETQRPIKLFTPYQERDFLESCNRWQFPIFLTLLMTGLRSGEVCHLLLPDDVDLHEGLLHVRNKPLLFWKVKTRYERSIPLHPVLVKVLTMHIQTRRYGPAFLRRAYSADQIPTYARTLNSLENELSERIKCRLTEQNEVSRSAKRKIANGLWQSIGTLDEDRIRRQLIRLTSQMGLTDDSSPKMLRHLFATALQQGRVDPLVRNELMGHVVSGSRSPGHGLAMTAVYTHTNLETKRNQLFEALEMTPAVIVAQRWLEKAENTASLTVP